MNLDQQTYELIDLYLKGELIGEEMDLFRIRLREDEAFLRQVQLQKAIVDSIEIERNRELKEIFKAKKKKGIVVFNRRVMAMAAIVLSIVALAIIFKMYLPFNELVRDDSISTDDPKRQTTEELFQDQAESEVPEASAEEQIDIVGNAELETIEGLAETESDDQEDDTRINQDQPGVALSELKEDEDKLQAKDIKAKKDELLGTKRVTLMAYSTVQTGVAAKNLSEVEAKDVEVTATNKKKANDADDAKAEDVEVDKPAAPAIISTPSQAIIIEFWKSIVNFKGYHYDGKTLMLYEVPQEAKLQILSYESKTYLRWDGNLYRILNNGKYEAFSRVSDPELLKVFNK